MGARATRDIWVFVETGTHGTALSGLELVPLAHRLAAGTGGDTVVVSFGELSEDVITKAENSGANRAIVASCEILSAYSSETYASAFEELMSESMPSVLLFGSTQFSREVASRLACRMSTGITTDVIDASVASDSGRIIWRRPVFGGAYVAKTICMDSYPQIAVAKQNAFKTQSVNPGKKIEVVRAACSSVCIKAQCELKEKNTEISGDELSIEDAQVVVAGGRGVGSAEGFDKLRELANLLGGTVACSRAVTDADWMPHNALVGQTGKTIAPKLYIACGISGAMQHTCGMEDSSCIVAINRDPDAPIFDIANFGIVGDLNVVIPAMIEEIKKSAANG